MSSRWMIPAVLALVACFSGGWFLQRQLAIGPDVYQQARLFEEVLAHVRDYHVDSLPESELYQRATEGMLKELARPLRRAAHRARTGTALQERTTGDYAGVGLQVDARNGWITVVSPCRAHPPIAPAFARATSSSRYREKPPRGGPWSVRCRRCAGSRADGGHRRPARGRRGAAALPAVPRADTPARRSPRGPARWRRGLPRHDDGAREQRRGAGEEVDRLVAAGMKSLVLDLRSNPGGLRDEAVQASDLFLDSRQDILVSRGRAPGDNHRWTDTAPAALALAPDRGAGESGHRQCGGDHCRRAAGS